MTQIPFDQLAKEFLKEFLTPLGRAERSLEVPGESKFVDVWFEPFPQSTVDSSSLGLLGRIATTPCLIEPFHNPPTRTEVRTCLLKLFWVHEDQRRQANRQESRTLEGELPKLWVLAADVSKPVLNDFSAVPNEQWLPGIYFLANALKTVIVAINQLPPTEETLWLRILGRDETQRQAISEVLALPATDFRRSKTLQMLTAWKVTIELTGTQTSEDEQLLMTLSQAYLEWEQETERRGERRGEKQGERKVIENLLKVRFGELDESLAALISQILVLPPEEYTPLLLQLSQEELLIRFTS
ncbi:flagellar assembly protein H (plasmid) [Phormidium sp. CLA17]|uniref:flagellar assembly protein H n=1 Tax=Leptolyngbya sp. Cla-17 TaxID=2803751 RepID=UPI001490DC88|nr:flagellar assembly protein H [Leptolyngbya sp. Cla-17]MBM0745519.1 flagellar assembly protein H [Leptolyngbya sp. Cla-17]